MKKYTLLLTLLSLLNANSITIYNNNLAFVNKKYDIKVLKSNEILIDNLPKTIIPDSIFINNLDLISKEFIPKDYDYIKSLIDANFGKEVEFIYNKKSLKGVISHKEPLVIKSNNSLYIIKDISNIIFKNEPAFISNSKLILHLAKEYNKKSLDLNYLVNGIKWRANYIILLNKNSLNLEAWADIKNSSGAIFKDIDIKLIAGELNRVSYYYKPRVFKRNVKIASSTPASSRVESKEIATYYSFKIPYKQDIKKSSQILLYRVKNLKYTQYGQAQNNSFYRYNPINFKFKDIIEFNNTKSNNLGKIMPNGIVRVYKDGIYLGEDRIANRSKNQKIKLAIGTIFDADGKREIVEFIQKEHYKKVVTKYTIKNRGSKDLILKLNENIPQYGEKVVYKTDCSNICKQNRIDAFRREFIIKLKAKGSYSWKTTFEAYY